MIFIDKPRTRIIKGKEVYSCHVVSDSWQGLYHFGTIWKLKLHAIRRHPHYDLQGWKLDVIWKQILKGDHPDIVVVSEKTIVLKSHLLLTKNQDHEQVKNSRKKERTIQKRFAIKEQIKRLFF